MRDVTRSIDRFKTGNARGPSLSPNVVDLAREAWLIASIEFGAARTRTGHLLCALVSDEDLARLARDISPEFAKISPDALKKDFPTLAEHSSESAGERRPEDRQKRALHRPAA